MKNTILLICLMLLNIRVIAQDSKLSALPADGKVTLSGSNLDWSLNPPTHVDIYKGTSNPPTDLYDIITPVPASFDWVDNEVENGVFYYYQFVARDENNGTVDEPSNVTGAMPAEGRGSYYVFDGIDDQVQQLNNEYMTRVNFIRFDFKIDELPTDKNAEIFRIQFKGTSSNNRSVLSVIHTADSLQVVVDRDTAPMIGRPSKGKSILTMPSVADGEWHEFRMIDIVRTQLTVRIDQDLYFIDMRDPGGVFDIPLVGAHDIFIGGQINDTTAYFNGCFDNLRFFGRFEQEGCWNFDEPSAELTVFDKGRKIRTMQKVGGVKSAADVFNPIILQAIAGKEGRIQLSSSTESVLNKLSSFTLFRQALPSGPVDTLKNDLDLVDFFPYEDLTVVQGTPYQYTIQYTASLSPTNDTTIAISDYNVPAMDFGNHYQFDGVDDVVTPDQAIINDDEGTIEFLVKIQPEDSPLPGSSLALAGKQNNAFRNGFMILHDNSRVWCQFRNGAGTRNNLYPARAVSLTDGKWHHVALTYVVGDSATLYVDGEQVVSGDINNLNFTTAPIQFGRAPDPFGAPLKGGLDEVVIWDQVLSPEEIGLRAFAKVRGDSEGLLASYHFDEGAGSIAYDSGPQDVHAQINGAITGQNTTDIPVRWLGTMSASWSEQENWSSGFVPQTDDNLVITALGNSPIIASTDVVEINDLMINQGASLTLESGGILAINGEVLNQGNFTAKRIPEANGKYSMIGSPLVDADISDFGADLTFGYDPLTATFTQEAGTAFPGNGYFVSYFENDPEIVLSGTPNSGNVSVPLTISLESPISYNLVANPYIAPISFDDFISGNQQVITGAIWLWDDGGVNVNDSRFGDYVTVNDLGSVNAVGGSTGSVWNGHIGSFQGFFVRTNTGGNLEFTPEMQVTEQGANSDINHFRGNEDQPFFSVKLSLSSKDLYNEIIVAMGDEATIEADQHLDAPKLKGNPDFAFYSWLNAEAYAIQAIPKADLNTPERVVSLGFDLVEPGEFELSVVELKHIPEDYSVILIDQLLGKEYRLTPESIIPFSVDKSVVGSRRFELQFIKKSIITNAVETLTKNLAVHGSENQLTVYYPSVENEIISIYRLDGRKIFEELVAFNGKAVIPVSLESDQLYILKIDNQTVKFTTQ